MQWCRLCWFIVVHLILCVDSIEISTSYVVVITERTCQLVPELTGIFKLVVQVISCLRLYHEELGLSAGNIGKGVRAYTGSIYMRYSSTCSGGRIMLKSLRLDFFICTFVVMAAFLLNHAPAISYGPLIPRVLGVLKKIKLSGHISGDAMTQMIAHCMVGVVRFGKIDVVGVVISKIGVA